MSMAALLIAKRDTLRQSLGSIIPGGSERAPQFVDIQPDGSPPAMFGDWFVGLDEVRIECKDTTFLKEVYYTVAVITHKAAQVPKDRKGSLYSATGSGLDAVERAVITAIHGNQALRVLANTLIGAPADDKGDIFQRPLFYLGRGPTVPKDGTWTGAAPDHATYLARALNFGGGTRIQALDIMH